MTSHQPYAGKRLPARQLSTAFESDGRQIHLVAPWPLPPGDPVTMARQLFDSRAAATISAATGLNGGGDAGPPRIWPVVGRLSSTPGHPPAPPWFLDKDLLELKWYDDKAPTVYLVRAKCLAVLAYADFFGDQPGRGEGLRSMVSRAILAASPGWCGTFGPGADDLFSLKGAEGNYDMSEMFLLPIAYRHYADISPAARKHLITQLLARGRIHRPRVDDTFTSKNNPNDWSRAGFTSFGGRHTDIGETENHILMIVTARYLTNQLMFQRDPDIDYDNRRNGGKDYMACTPLLLMLLRRMLRGDFSEYNAKSYESETRHALLNLCSYAYDHEVRLGARMVLDYLSAHVAVSSNDLRRLVPFRRRNNAANAPHTANGFMTVGLLRWQDGADRMAPYFAMQAGNVRAYRLGGIGRSPIRYTLDDSGMELALEVLSEYRVPPSIHDLFVDDRHRRFFQRLHRTRQRDEVGGNRNCDNMEIYASSPSYLISAGGAPASFAVNPDLHAFIDPDAEAEQLGVALTTSFMRTGHRVNDASSVIQFGEFSENIKSFVKLEIAGQDVFEINAITPKNVANYGVAPDFACGHQVWLPEWVNRAVSQNLDGAPVDPHSFPGFSFVNLRNPGPAGDNAPGLYLAIYQQTPGGLAMLEAHDTWLHPELTFEQFKRGVHDRNGGLTLLSNHPTRYVTSNLNEIDFVIWNKSGDGRDAESGAEVLTVRYGNRDRGDARGGAETRPSRLVNGTIMNTLGEAVVEIANPLRGTTLTLDFGDEAHPRRHDSETGEFEVAGFNNEVWLNFDHVGLMEGDVCRPFNTLTGAIDAVAQRGVIRIVPGVTRQRGVIGGAKKFTLLAPIGGVTLGTRDGKPGLPFEDPEEISNRDVWVQFDWLDSVFTHPPFLFNRLSEAIQAVADQGRVHIEPGATRERGMIGRGKRCTLVAPIGGVTLGVRT